MVSFDRNADPSETARRLRSEYEAGKGGAVEAIRAALSQYKFYHNIEIVPGVVTEGIPWTDGYVREITRVMSGIDFAGKRVLDVGCRDGALSFEAERLGASETVGIDNDLSDGLIEFLIPFRKSNIRAQLCNVNDLSKMTFGEFDIVLFPGVLYHLRYPVWALRRIMDVMKPGGILLIESGFIDAFGDLPVIFCPVGSDSPYEPSSVTFFNEAGVMDTLVSIGFSNAKVETTFWPTFTEEQEASFTNERFPLFTKLYAGQNKLSVCRKIVTCIKKWSSDPRLLTEDQSILLERYWDGTHKYHTTGEL